MIGISCTYSLSSMFFIYLCNLYIIHFSLTFLKHNIFSRVFFFFLTISNIPAFYFLFLISVEFKSLKCSVDTIFIPL